MKDYSKQPFPILTIKSLFDNGDLILNPDYQRNAVWTKSQKQLLIDSLFSGIDIPKIYLNLQNDKYEVVDGQQRIRAILDFYEDKFALPSESEDDIKDKTFSELPLKYKTKFPSLPVDAVILKDWSDEEIEEMFLRLQEGAPLNAAEKRRAIAGNFRDVVRDLSENKIFFLVGFTNNRYAYEDAAAKVLHIALNGDYTSITPSRIKKTYIDNCDIRSSNSIVKDIQKSFNLISKGFKNQDVNPKLKKWSIITLTLVVKELLNKYNIENYSKELAESFLKFELDRLKNSELPEENQDSKLTAFSDAVRGDDVAKMSYRHKILLERIINDIKELEQKDKSRNFTPEQRIVIFYKDNGVCKICKKNVSQDDDYEADHIKPWSKGGKTTVDNGQVLCSSCNKKKSNS